MDASDQFAEIARQLAAEPDVSSTLDGIVSLAVEHVEGCDGAGILLAHGNEIVAGSWSDDVVQRVETLEYELSEGPCVDAIRQQPVFESPDLRDHLDDWPHFAQAALDAGIESIL